MTIYVYTTKNTEIMKKTILTLATIFTTIFSCLSQTELDQYGTYQNYGNTEDNIQVYPNPTEGNATIRIISYQYNTLTIQNTNGQIVDVEIQNDTINLENLASGLYVIRLENLYGQIKTKTLIVI